MSRHLRDVISLIIVFLSIVVVVYLLTRRMEGQSHQAGIRIQPAGLTTGSAPAYTAGVKASSVGAGDIEPPGVDGEAGYPVSVMELTDAYDQ